ncbi:MAG: hypothetical protein IPN76_04040 [Saprospiraceae bacterium]|nr:hypothetical protein [Saprospiraceae bacterium]
MTNIQAQTFTEVEPNNSFALSNTVSVPVTITLSIDPSNDNDYFKVNLPTCGVLSAMLSGLPTNQSIQIYAYNAMQAQIGYASSPSAGVGFTYDFLLTPGIAYLKVKSSNS